MNWMTRKRVVSVAAVASDDVANRTTPIACLRSQPEVGSEAEAAARVEAYLRSGSPADRRAVATALAHRPRPSALHCRLLELLDDPDPRVRREAIAASGVVRLREFIPALILQLRAPQTRDAARAALVAFGNGAVGTIGDCLADDTVPLPIRRELPLVLAAVGTQEAANELARAPDAADTTLLLRLLEAEGQIRSRDPQVVFPRAGVREALREAETFLQLQRHVAVWRAEPPSRARDVLLPSLEERLSAADRRRVDAASLYGLRPLDRASSLAALARGSDSWLQVCALYSIGALRLRELVPAARDALRAAAPLVRETATWCLQQLEPA